MKLSLSFLSSRFATWPKIQDKNLNILRTKKAFKVKEKAFFIIFKGLSVASLILFKAVVMTLNVLTIMYFASLPSYSQYCNESLTLQDINEDILKQKGELYSKVYFGDSKISILTIRKSCILHLNKFRKLEGSNALFCRMTPKVWLGFEVYFILFF